jgi:hypothetical protein
MGGTISFQLFRIALQPADCPGYLSDGQAERFSGSATTSPANQYYTVFSSPLKIGDDGLASQKKGSDAHFCGMDNWTG